jgi:predicted Zn-dependent peptidase
VRAVVRDLERAGLVVACVALVAVGAGCSSASRGRHATGLESLEKSVEEFTLGNGIHFLLVERHDSPVFSFETVVNAGSADDTPGATGLAHMMEHMAFKGTPWVGVRDAAAEAPLLHAEEDAYQALTSARAGAHPDTAQVRQLENRFAAAQAAAEQQVEPEEFSRILERAGARDVNAETSSDATAYVYSIPSNQLELWALMEGGRLSHPVFRQFYRERDVVIEERRMSTESSPFGRLADAFVHAAFTVHPYGQGTIGAAADLKSLTRTEGEAFFHRHYVAPAMTVAVVGDVTLPELRKVAERYFADVPAGPAPPGVQKAVEPEQRSERRAILEDAAQPIVMIGWHMPACTDPQFPAWQALADLLGGGDHARLQKALVRDAAIAVDVQTTTGFPGEKYPGLWGVLTIPAEGVAPDSLERAAERVVEDVRSAHPFSQAELDGYKVRVRAQKLGAVEENASLAHELGHAQALQRDWRAFFREQDRVQALTLDDLTRALGAFTAENRVVAMLAPPKPGAKPGANGRP